MKAATHATNQTAKKKVAESSLEYLKAKCRYFVHRYLWEIVFVLKSIFFSPEFPAGSSGWWVFPSFLSEHRFLERLSSTVRLIEGKGKRRLGDLNFFYRDRSQKRKGGCQFGKSKLSVNLATAHPANLANIFVSSVNVANLRIWVGVGNKKSRKKATFFLSIDSLPHDLTHYSSLSKT